MFSQTYWNSYCHRCGIIFTKLIYLTMDDETFILSDEDKKKKIYLNWYISKSRNLYMSLINDKLHMKIGKNFSI